jgi:hypothetical protein
MELHLRLEQGYDQFKNLEKERKKTEAALARQNPGKKLNSTNHHPIPRLPPNPTRVDKLVIDSLREHARVVTLISRMERLRGLPLNPGIHVSMEAWVDKVMSVQDRRREEIVNQRDKDVLALAEAISSLSSATRRARTSLWSALQATVLRDLDDDQTNEKNKIKDCVALPFAMAAAEVEATLENKKKKMKLEENKDALEKLLSKMK